MRHPRCQLAEPADRRAGAVPVRRRRWELIPRLCAPSGAGWIAALIWPLAASHGGEAGADAARGGPGVILSEDYSSPLTVSRNWDAAKSNVHDDTGYAGVRPVYSAVEASDATAGKALQIGVPGFLQTILGNVKAVAGRTYRVKLRLRCLGQQTVEVMIRRKPAPYRRYWTTSVEAGEAWREYDLLGHVPAVYKGKEDPDACLMLVLKAATTLWIDFVRLEQLPADYTPAPDPEPAPGNVLLNSSFELGLEGWYHHSAVQSAAATAHSGGRALRFSGRQGITSTWYALARGRQYQVSAWCKAQGGPVRVRFGVSRNIWPTGGTSVLRNVDLREGRWERVGFEFTVPDALRAPDPYFYFRLWAIPTQAESALLVDDVMLCPGAKGAEYTPRHAVEIRARSREPRGVHPPGADVALDLRVWNPGRVSIPRDFDVLVFDESGRELLQRRTELRDGRAGSCTIKGLQTGYWRVATRTGLAGEVCSEAETFIAMAPAMPDVPDTEFFLGSHMSNDRDSLGAAYRLGIRWDRFHDIMGTPTKWVTLEPQKGNWRTEEPLQVAMRREAGVQMLGLLDRCPGWVQGLEGKDRRGRTRHFHAMLLRKEDIPNWRKYVHRTVTQFRDDIQVWEITNEPQHSARRKLPAGGPGQQYAMIAEAAVEEIRRADPDATIVGVGGTNTHHTTFLRSLGEAGVFSFLDRISIHSYGTGAAPCGLGPASYMRCVDGVRALVREYSGGDIEIWDTESGIPINSASRRYRTLPGQEAYSGAILYTKMFVARRAAGIRKWFLFHAKIQPDCCARGCGHYFELNDTVTPAALTLAVAVHFLQRAVFDRIEEEADEGIVRVHFHRPEDRVTVMWSNKGSQRVPLPTGASAFSVWGRTAQRSGNLLPIDASPVFVVH